MNKNSLIKHYRILKNLTAFAKILFTNIKNPDIGYKMQWTLFESDEDVYHLYFNKDICTFELTRVHKQLSTGYRIAEVGITKKSNGYFKSNNYIFGGTTAQSFGIRYSGSRETMLYISPDDNSSIELEPLPIESMKGLIVDDSYEEMEFQYGTLHDFKNESFQMYCIYSLLHHVDEIGEEVSSGYVYEIDLFKNIYESDLEGLSNAIEDLINTSKEQLSC